MKKGTPTRPSVSLCRSPLGSDMRNYRHESLYARGQPQCSPRCVFEAIGASPREPSDMIFNLGRCVCQDQGGGSRAAQEARCTMGLDVTVELLDGKGLITVDIRARWPMCHGARTSAVEELRSVYRAHDRSRRAARRSSGQQSFGGRSISSLGTKVLRLAYDATVRKPD